MVVRPLEIRTVQTAFNTILCLETRASLFPWDACPARKMLPLLKLNLSLSLSFSPKDEMNNNPS